jgi:ferredoxin-NADP reductase
MYVTIRFMIVSLKTRQEIAKGFLLIEFDTRGQIVNFVPGQFFNLSLINPPYADERGNKRIFGFTNTPKAAGVEMITKSGVSAFKKALQEIPIGTQAQIDGIDGRIDLPKDLNQPVVFVAGGIGIAPIMSMLRSIKEKHLAYKISLIYANEDKESTPFLDELEAYAKENPNFKFIPTTAVNSQLIQTNFPNLNENLYFVKGEQQFVMPTIKILRALGIEANKISLEIFTGY